MQFRGKDNACLVHSLSRYQSRKLLLFLPTSKDFIKCTQIMKPTLNNVPDLYDWL